MPEKKVTILLPCHNEGPVIADVVKEFKAVAENATIYIVDNACTDDTVEQALSQGAKVIREPKRGKGNAIRRAFMEIESDIYVMVDGDGTYQADALPEMLEKFSTEKLDMLVGIRMEEDSQNDLSAAYRRGHRLGNSLFNKLF